MPEDKIKLTPITINENSVANTNSNTIPPIVPNNNLGLNSDDPMVTANQALQEQNTQIVDFNAPAVLRGVNTRLNYNIEDYAKYTNGHLDVPWTNDIESLNTMRATNQSLLEKGWRTVNPLARIASVGLGLIKDIGYIAELPEVVIGKSDFNNGLIEWATKTKNDIIPRAYRTNPGKTFDFGDPTWYLNNGADLWDSISEFLLLGYGIGKVASWTSKGLISIAKTGKALETGINLTTKTLSAASLTYFESAYGATDAYQRINTSLLSQINPSTGKMFTPKEAHEYASGGAYTAFGTNMVVGTILNMPTMELIMPAKRTVVKGASTLAGLEGETIAEQLTRLQSLDLSNDIIKKAMTEYSAGKILLEGNNEGIEEILNNWAVQVGVDMGEANAQGDNQHWYEAFARIDTLMSQAMSPEGVLAYTLGAIGGIGQTMGMKVLPSSLGYERDKGGNIQYTESGQPINKTATILGQERNWGFNLANQKIEENFDVYNVQRMNIIKDLEFITDTNKRITKLENSNNSEDIAEAERLRNDLFALSSYHSVFNQQGENLINTMNTVAAADNTVVDKDGKTEAMRLGITNKPDSAVYKSDHKEKALELIPVIQKVNAVNKRIMQKYNTEQDMYYGIPGLVADVAIQATMAEEALNNKLTDNAVKYANLTAFGKLQLQQQVLSTILADKKSFASYIENIKKEVLRNRPAFITDNKVEQITRYKKVLKNKLKAIESQLKTFENADNKIVLNNTTTENALTDIDNITDLLVEEELLKMNSFVNNASYKYIIKRSTLSKVKEQKNKLYEATKLAQKKARDKKVKAVKTRMAKDIKNTITRNKKKDIKKAQEVNTTDNTTIKNTKDVEIKNTTSKDNNTIISGEVIVKQVRAQEVVDALKAILVLLDDTEAVQKIVQQLDDFNAKNQYKEQLSTLIAITKQLVIEYNGDSLITDIINKQLAEVIVLENIRNANNTQTKVSNKIDNLTNEQLSTEKEIDIIKSSKVAKPILITPQNTEELVGIIDILKTIILLLPENKDTKIVSNKLDTLNTETLDSTDIDNLLALTNNIINSSKIDVDIKLTIQNLYSNAIINNKTRLANNEITNAANDLLNTFEAITSDTTASDAIKASKRGAAFLNLIALAAKDVKSIGLDMYRDTYKRVLVANNWKENDIKRIHEMFSTLIPFAETSVGHAPSTYDIAWQFKNTVNYKGDIIDMAVQTGNTGKPYGFSENSSIEQQTEQVAITAKNYKKVNNPSESIANKEQEGVLDKSTGKYINVDNVTTFSVADNINIGDEIIFKVDTHYDGYIITDIGERVIWEDYSKNLGKTSSEYINNVPIKITTKDGKLLGYLHTINWLSESNNNVQDNIDIAAHSTNLNQIRRTIINSDTPIISTVTVKKAGSINTTYDNSKNLVSVQMPNLKNGAIVVFRNGKFEQVKNKSVAVDNLHWFNDFIFSGMPAVLTTMSNGETYAVPVTSTKLGDKVNSELLNGIINLIQLYASPKTEENKISRNNIAKEFGFDSLSATTLYTIISKLVYLEGFTDETIMDLAANQDSKVRDLFNINKKTGTIRFATTATNDKITPYTIYELHQNGNIFIKKPNKDKQILDKQQLTNSLDDILVKLSSILKNKVVNTDLEMLNNSEVFMIPYTDDDGIKVVKFESYEEFIKTKLLTNIVEKRQSIGGKIKIIHSVQSTVEFDSTFANTTRQEDSDIATNIKDSIIEKETSPLDDLFGKQESMEEYTAKQLSKPKLTITSEQQEQLKNLGYTQEEINKINPAVVTSILTYKIKPAVEVTISTEEKNIKLKAAREARLLKRKSKKKTTKKIINSFEAITSNNNTFSALSSTDNITNILDAALKESLIPGLSSYEQHTVLMNTINIIKDHIDGDWTKESISQTIEAIFNHYVDISIALDIVKDEQELDVIEDISEESEAIQNLIDTFRKLSLPRILSMKSIYDVISDDANYNKLVDIVLKDLQTHGIQLTQQVDAIDETTDSEMENDNETSDITIRNKWNIENASVNTFDRTSSEFKAIIRTIPQMDFVHNTDGTIKFENGEPVMQKILNVMGTTEFVEPERIQQELFLLLQKFSHLSTGEKYNAYIKTLLSTDHNTAHLVVLGKMFQEASDKIKAELINTISTQKTNAAIVIWKKNLGVDNNVHYGMYVKNSSKPHELDKLRSIWNSHQTQQITNKLIENNAKGLPIVKATRVAYWQKYYMSMLTDIKVKNLLIHAENKNNKNNKTKRKLLELPNMPDNLVLKLFNEIGINLTQEQLNELKHIETNELLKSFFNHKNMPSVFRITRYPDLFIPNGLIDTMIKDMGNPLIDELLFENNPLTSINSKVLDAIANVQLSIEGGYGTTTFTRGNGTMQQTYSQNTALSHKMNRLLDIKELPNGGQEMSSEFNMHANSNIQYSGRDNNGEHKSKWLDDIENGKAGQFQVGVVDSLKQGGVDKSAVLRTKATRNELLVDELARFTNSGNKTAQFLILAFSDKSTAATITAPKIVTDISFSNNKPKFRQLQRNQIWQYILLPEVDRINNHAKRIIDGTITRNTSGNQYYEGGLLFQLTPYLNTHELMLGDKAMRNEDGTIDVTPETKQLLIDVVEKEILASAEETKADMLSAGMFRTRTVKNKNDNSETTIDELHFVDKQYLRTLDNTLTTKQKLQYIAIDFAFNKAIATTEFTKLFGGDMANVYKNKGISKNKQLNTFIKNNKFNYVQYLNANKNILQQQIAKQWGEYIKRMAKDIAPGIDGYWVDSEGRNHNIFNQAYINDLSLDLSGYTGVEGGDAQQYSTLKEFVIVQHGYGKISDDTYSELMAQIEEVELINKEIIDKNKDKPLSEILPLLEHVDLTNDYLTELEEAVRISPLKPVYVGDVINEEQGRIDKKYIKVAVFPLIGNATTGTEIDYLRRRMEYEEIITGKPVNITYTSGVKIGLNNVSTVWKPNTTTNATHAVANKHGIENMQFEQLHRDGYRIQQEEPTHVHTETVTVTQANKLLWSGIMRILDNTGVLSGFKHNGSDMNVEELKEQFHTIKKQLSNNGVDQLNRRLGLNTDGTFKDLTKLVALIKDEMYTRNYPESDIASMEMTSIDGQQQIKLPIAFQGNGQRIEALINSIITKETIKTKMPGRSYVQVSGHGIGSVKSLSNTQKSDIVFTELYTDNHLKFVTNENGVVTYAQCLVPFNITAPNGELYKIEDFLITKDGKQLLDTTRLPKDILKLIGLRIPNQGHSSMLLLEIAGFLPSYMHDNIIVPPEITAQMGADFDFDHLYTYSFNTEQRLTAEAFNTYKEQFDNLIDTRGIIKYMNQQVAEKYVGLQNKLQTATEDDKKIISKEIKKLQLKAKKKLYIEFLNNGNNVVIAKINSAVTDYSIASKEELQNAYVETFHTVLSHTAVAKKMTTPLDLPYLASEADKIDKIINSIGENNFNPLSTRFSTDMYLANQAGKLGVAIQSIASTFLALIEDKSLKLTNSVNRNKIDLNIKISTDNGVIKLNKLGLGNYTNTKGDNISNADILLMLQNEAVDNAKNLNLASLFYNKDTASIYNVLAMLISNNKETLPLEFLVRFINQEAIKSYINKLQETSSTIAEFTPNAKQKIFDDLLKEYINKGANKTEINNYVGTISNGNYTYTYTESDLLKALKSKKRDSNYYQLQAETLIFVKTLMDNVIQPVQNVISATNGIDTVGLGKDIFTTIAKQQAVQTYLLENSVVLGAGSIIYDTDNNYTEIGTMYNNSVNLSLKILSTTTNNDGTSILPYTSKYAEKIFMNYADILGKDILSVQDYKDIWRATKQLIVSKIIYNTTNADSLANLRKSLFFGDTSLGVQLKNVENEPWFKENRFLLNGINRLIVKDDNVIKYNKETSKYEALNNTTPILVKYEMGVKKDTDDYRNIEAILELLYTSISEYETIKDNILDTDIHKAIITKYEFAQSLVNYTILEGGIQNAQNWVKYLPISYLEAIGFNKSIRDINFNSIDVYDTISSPEVIIRQYLQHNPKKAKTFNPQYVKSTTKNNNIITLPSAYEKNSPYSDIIKIEIIAGEEYKSYPQYIKYYDVATHKYYLYENTDKNKNETDIIFRRLPLLGTDKLGFNEYDGTIQYAQSNLTDKQIYTEQELIELNKVTEIATIPNMLSNIYDDTILTTPTSESIWNRVEELANNNTMFSVAAKILLANKDLAKEFEVTINNSGARGMTRVHNNTKDLKTIDISPRLFETTKTSGNVEAQQTELNEIVLHEMLHGVLSKIINNAMNGVGNNNTIKAVQELDNLRKSIIKNNQVEFNAYMDTRGVSSTAENIAKFEGLTNIHEFFSYAFTNSSFQNFLNTQARTDNGKGTLLNQLLELLSVILDTTILENIAEDKALYQVLSMGVTAFTKIIPPNTLINNNSNNNYSAITSKSLNQAYIDNKLINKDNTYKRYSITDNNYKKILKQVANINKQKLPYKAKIIKIVGERGDNRPMAAIDKYYKYSVEQQLYNNSFVEPIKPLSLQDIQNKYELTTKTGIMKAVIPTNSNYERLLQTTIKINNDIAVNHIANVIKTKINNKTMYTIELLNTSTPVDILYAKATNNTNKIDC